MSQRPDIINCLLPLFKVVKSSNQIHCIEANHHRASPSIELKGYLLQCEQQFQESQCKKSKNKNFGDLNLRIDKNETQHTRETNESNDNIEENIKSCQFDFKLNNNHDISDLHLGKLSSILIDSLQLASNDDEILVICGSAFIMSDIRYLLGIGDSRDDI